MKAGHHHLAPSPDDRHVYATYQTKPPEGKSGRFLSRIGVRPNGSLYANGPYARVLHDGDEPLVTPKPSGAPLTDSSGDQIGTVFDHSSSSAATASSYADGGTHHPQMLRDGEIGIKERLAKYDWLADGQRAGAWVNLGWTRSRPVDQILIYPSANPNHRVRSGRLELSDGQTINITFPADQKAPAVIGAGQLGSRVFIASLRFTVTEMRANATGAAALSEISVLGPPL